MVIIVTPCISECAKCVLFHCNNIKDKEKNVLSRLQILSQVIEDSVNIRYKYSVKGAMSETQDMFAGLLLLTKKGKPPIEVMTIYIDKEGDTVKHVIHYGIPKQVTRALSKYRTLMSKQPESCEYKNALSSEFYEVHTAPALYKDIIIRILRDKEPMFSMRSDNNDNKDIEIGEKGNDIIDTVQMVLDYIDAKFEQVNQKIDTHFDNELDKINYVVRMSDNNKTAMETLSFQVEELTDIVTKMSDKQSDESVKDTVEGQELHVVQVKLNDIAEQLTETNIMLTNIYQNAPILKAPPSMLQVEESKIEAPPVIDNIVNNAIVKARQLVQERMKRM